MLKLIEGESFKSQLLQSIQSSIHQEEHKASEMLRTFTRKVDLFNNRNNFLVGIFGNALLLWDSQTIFGVERWIENNRDTVQNWIGGIFEFDAYLSLAIFKSNHSDFIFPQLLDSDANIILKGNSMGHPLIKKNICVTNDVTINDENFLIITGANMAGKSTFLRTVALSIVLCLFFRLPFPSFVYCTLVLAAFVDS